nr:hypothetical protein [Tanacetum cinerariifolium]
MKRFKKRLLSQVACKRQHVSHPHKSVRENDIQESKPKVLRKRQAYTQLEDEEIQEEVQTESGDHEDYSEDDHEVNSPQTETEIGSTSHEKNKSAALEEKLKEVATEQDDVKKCMGLMMQEIHLSKLDKSHTLQEFLLLSPHY